MIFYPGHNKGSALTIGRRVFVHIPISAGDEINLSTILRPDRHKCRSFTISGAPYISQSCQTTAIGIHHIQTKERTCYLGNRVRQSLWQYVAGRALNEPLFPLQSGRPLNVQQVWGLADAPGPLVTGDGQALRQAGCHRRQAGPPQSEPGGSLVEVRDQPVSVGDAGSGRALW
jgi:hypothetical protein